MLKFSFRKFADKKVCGEKINMPTEMIRALKSWDGKQVHKFGKNSVRRNIFGEEYYILVSTEKIAIGREFCIDE